MTEGEAERKSRHSSETEGGNAETYEAAQTEAHTGTYEERQTETQDRSIHRSIRRNTRRKHKTEAHKATQNINGKH